VFFLHLRNRKKRGLEEISKAQLKGKKR
jgi:hypothetical protein